MIRIPMLALAGLLALGASAQAAPKVERMRGTIEKVEAGAFTMKTIDGHTEQVTLGPDARISWVVPASLDQIKDGVFIGTATKGEPPVAIEVVLFPESMRGSGEGHYDWDMIPDTMGGGTKVKSAMTNGTVKASGAGAERTLTVDYGKGQSIQVLVPPQAPVVTFETADHAALSVGAKAFVVVAHEDDGKLTARRVAVGKDGLTPPM